MNDLNFPSPDLALTPELRNDFVAIAKEIYKVMEPYRNQSETAVKAMQQAMSAIALPDNYFKKWQLDLEVPFAQLAKETAELSKTIDMQLFTKQFALTMQQASRILQAVDGPDMFVPVEEAEELYQQAKPIIPENAAAAVEQRIEVAKKQGNKIPWRDIMTVISFILGVLTFVKEELPDKHEQFVEAALSVIIEKMDTEAPSTVEVCENCKDSGDELHAVDDFVDSQRDTDNGECLSEKADTQK